LSVSVIQPPHACERAACPSQKYNTYPANPAKVFRKGRPNGVSAGVCLWLIRHPEKSQKVSQLPKLFMRTIFFLLVLTISFAHAESSELVKQPPICTWRNIPSLASVYHENPKKFAQVLTEELLTLKSIIPTATPSEKDWLSKELEGDIYRHFRARDSLINAQVEIEDYINRTLRSLEFLTGQRTAKIAHSMDWSFFAAQMVGESQTIGDHAQRLVSAKLIKQDSLPQMWRLLSTADTPVSVSVVHHHRNIVKHILTCILPAVPVQQNP
jgi:hypothetical protein